MRSFIRLVPVVGVFVCGPVSVLADEIVVSAASSLSEAMSETAETFEKANPGVEVVLNFGGSGALAQQIRHGAPADCYVSAAEYVMHELADDGLIRADSIRTLWSNTLVLVVRGGIDPEAGWEVLRGEGIRRVALGEFRSVPAGRYGRETLEHLSLWEELLPTIVFTKDVRQALTYVASGAVDAGIVYETDLRVVSGMTAAAVAPPGSHTPILYPAGILTRSKHPEVAESFILFLASPDGRQHFRRHGFVPVGDKP